MRHFWKVSRLLGASSSAETGTTNSLLPVERDPKSGATLTQNSLSWVRLGSCRSCTIVKWLAHRTYREDECGRSLRSYLASRVSIISRFPGSNNSGMSRTIPDSALTPTPTSRPNSAGAGQGGLWAGRPRPRPRRYFEAGVSCTGRRAGSDPKPELSEEPTWVSVLLNWEAQPCLLTASAWTRVQEPRPTPGGGNSEATRPCQAL